MGAHAARIWAADNILFWSLFLSTRILTPGNTGQLFLRHGYKYIPCDTPRLSNTSLS